MLTADQCTNLGNTPGLHIDVTELSSDLMSSGYEVIMGQAVLQANTFQCFAGKWFGIHTGSAYHKYDSRFQHWYLCTVVHLLCSLKLIQAICLY